MARELNEAISCPNQTCGGMMTRSVLMEDDGTTIHVTPWVCSNCGYTQ